MGYPFNNDRAGFSLSEMNTPKNLITTGFSVNANKDLVYRNFYGQPEGVYYWTLPSQYLGNKVCISLCKQATSRKGIHSKKEKCAFVDICKRLTHFCYHETNDYKATLYLKSVKFYCNLKIHCCFSEYKKLFRLFEMSEF